ncbi:hypothetical protein EJB05_43912 [Eragrostis curvula]|uniref:Myb/SANT-like domain-containing protein n=1 Tax=Eragrostis curvula TaxID=38414 RepID=A0A5J9TGM1_9POAL|nr:hypothetical protein EJB05_43912 [Eragrostis curvula]
MGLHVRGPLLGRTKASSCWTGILSTRKISMQGLFGKRHHMKCADALNKEFGMGVTVAQVDRHYRDFKEKWNIVEKALNNSGNGFDVTRCKVTISESEKAKLNDRARRLLSKPIKFFHEMQELFQGTNADGSLAKDQETCMDDEESDSDDRGGINDMSGYEKAVDIPSDDSDTLPLAKRLKTSPGSAEGGENSSSNTPRSGANRPRPKGMKSPAKKPSKPKSRLSEATEVFSSTMQTLAKAFAEPPPPPRVPKLDHNPYANLWKRLEAMPLRTEDKINVGVYLARPECEGMRSFLDASSDHTLETWVYQFICGQDGH